jgi:hypothetical protein
MVTYMTRCSISQFFYFVCVCDSYEHYYSNLAQIGWVRIDLGDEPG